MKIFNASPAGELEEWVESVGLMKNLIKTFSYAGYSSFILNIVLEAK